MSVTLPMKATRRASRGSNKNDVPSAAQRRALKAWMLGTFGDGITAPCCMCGRVLFWSEITRDRFPIPGRRGGRYVKGNVRPCCLSCNAAEGARQAAIERTEAELRRQARNARRRELYAMRRDEALRAAVRPVEPSGGSGATEGRQAA